jgi:HPt (histidine-containing phosphotransfer) domain-containing protein
MQAARGAGNLDDLARQAHKMKGASRLVGAQELAAAATEVEAAAKQGDWAGVLPHCADVATAVERLRRHIEETYS